MYFLLFLYTFMLVNIKTAYHLPNLIDLFPVTRHSIFRVIIRLF